MDMIVKTIKKAEHWRIDAFELWCWRRLFFFLLLNFNFYFILLYNTVSLLDCKEIQPVHHKGNQSWIFTGRTDAEAETQILGHLIWRTDSLEKTLMLGKIKGRMRRGQQRLKLSDCITQWTGREFEQARGIGDGQGSLACFSPWCCEELDITK